MEFRQNQFQENRGYFQPKDIGDVPENPGVYIMKSRDGQIIYIGKAKNLKKRVSSYFQKESSQSLKTRLLVENIAIIDTISVSNEAEALILEANLIKENMPKYNVKFKDNKFYPFIKVTVKDDFPRIVFSREQRKDGSIYFGPYISARTVRQYIDLVQRLFLIRTCVEMPKKECLNYYIKRSSAPCINKITKEAYRENVNEAVKFLSGQSGGLIQQWEKQMKKAARELLFEKAQILKEKIDVVRSFEENQIVFLAGNVHADFIGLFSKMGKIVFVVSIVRNGKMVGKRSYTASLQIEEEPADVLSSFILEYYEHSDKKQDHIVVDESFKNILNSVNSYFVNRDLALRLSLPGNEKERSIVRMAVENAGLHMMQIISKVDASESLKLLQDILNLDTLPMRIEGFDIANILGENAVASLVSFYGGRPDKKNYRHFKIKSKTTPDDFAMINEAVGRRYKRLRDENSELPDLILIDGGKGQLNAALEALAGLGISLNVISLAKKNEEIYIPFNSQPIVLEKNSPALHILQQVRDETHRFANTFYNKVKGKALLGSVFENISGIGEKRKKIILQKFLNHDIMKDIKLENLVDAGIPITSAEKVLEKLKKLQRFNKKD